ncbi:hypothetical protein HNQ08_003567 [Deinococcus humi]|uniref:Uncharacterized protein n=1 Tax=Deinococcus humi TaxID=662880 RepID=A0A7W8NG53_9DEIO|nr:hypothetical protein [Deinococcus humi]
MLSVLLLLMIGGAALWLVLEPLRRAAYGEHSTRTATS